ncbi:MAG TPA: hypothetical protein VF962_02015 [Gemmatimonadaceae bacterium]
MRRFASLVFIAAVACATDKNTEKIADPDFALVQLSQMPEVARNVTGGFPVQYRLHVGNRAAVPITLRRVNVQSVGLGAYDVPSTSRPFNLAIAPEKSVAVDFFVPVIVTQPTILGANGPVTLRGVVTFDSELGPFQRTFLLQANERPAAP